MCKKGLFTLDFRPFLEFCIYITPSVTKVIRPQYSLSFHLMNWFSVEPHFKWSNSHIRFL